MHARRIGGALVIGGLVACLAALAVIVVGDPVGGGLHSVATLIFPAALAPVAIGAIILGVAGPAPVHARSIRAGLTMLGVGLLGYRSASYVPAPDGMNSLQSWPRIHRAARRCRARRRGPARHRSGVCAFRSDKNRSSRWHRHTL